MADYQERIKLVETLLDDSVDWVVKKDIREEYCLDHGVTDRTIRNYIAWYKREGAGRLLFYRPTPPAERITDPKLKQAILSLVTERPMRTVRQLRYLLSSQQEFKDKIAVISNRTIYRFLFEQGMSKKERYALLSGDKRTSYRQFQAVCSLALVQGDARDGIWLKRPNGKKLKTYLFAWVDDYSRKILYAEYYTDEKLPRRVTDLSWFEALFLLRQERTVTKYGQIKLFGNKYPIKDVPHGTVVEVRFNPFNLQKIYIFKDKMLFATIEASTVNTVCAPKIPEENKDSPLKVSQASRNYFANLREQYQDSLKKESASIPYSKLENKEDKYDQK
jgi:transposase